MTHIAGSAPPVVGAALDAVADAVLIVDEQLRITCANRRAQALCGYTAEELVGGPVERLMARNAGTGGPRVWALAGEHGAAGGPAVDLSIRHRDGRDVPVQVQIAEAILDGVRHAVITLRERADRDYMAAVERLAGVIEFASDAIFTTDLGGVLTSWNPGAHRLYGYAPEEIIGRSVRLIIPPDRAHEMDEVLDRVSSGRPVPPFETTRVCNDGSSVSVSISVSPMRDATGAIVGVSTVARDVTDRRRAEERTRALLESAPDAVIVVGDYGLMRFVNRQTEELFGYQREQLLGEEVEMLIPERMRDVGDHSVSEFIAADDRPAGAALELVGLRADGSEFPIEITFSPLRTAEATLVYVAIRDITERKAIEEELRRSNYDLEQFAYVASHDLSEPLRVIAGFVDLLARRYRGQLDEEADRFINFTVAGVERMQTLIEDLLAYSRAGRVHIELREVDVEAVVREVLWSLEPQLEERAVSVEVGPLPHVQAEQALLRQIFQNLITNAIKFSDAQEPRIAVRASRLGATWRFDVEDNGPGVEPRHAERVFEMFQRLHGREVAGSGMGLAIVKRLTERHGGRVWVSAAEPRGSVFSFTIPDRA